MKTTYVGTRGYQAPELLLDKPYDLTCDVFSAGVVLFILLTGCMCCIVLFLFWMRIFGCYFLFFYFLIFYFVFFVE